MINIICLLNQFMVQIMSKISELINKEPDKSVRQVAKQLINNLIDNYSLKGPEGYGVTFEGMTCARWQPWNNIESLKTFKTSLSLDRLYMVMQFAQLAPIGDFYEFGVYTGGVTDLLSLICKQHVHAYDTFEGIKGANEHDLMDDGEYNGGISYFDFNFNVKLHEGDVRETFTDTVPQLAFAHIDMDVYEPTAHVLPIVYKSLMVGGYIVLDDYGLWMTPGVKKAVDEFTNINKNVKHFYLPTGQMVITK